jgi:hypothetical protein
LARWVGEAVVVAPLAVTLLAVVAAAAERPP